MPIRYGVFFVLVLCSGIALRAQEESSRQVISERASLNAVSSADLASLEERLAALEAAVSASAYGLEFDPGCGAAASCCCPCDCPTGGFLAGAEVVFVMPFFEDNVAFVQQVDAGRARAIPFDTEFDAAPRLWIGSMTADGNGVRTCYWQYDQVVGAESAVATRPAGLTASVFSAAEIRDVVRRLETSPGNRLDATAGMEIHVVDWDVFKRFELGRVAMTANAGVRYVLLAQEYRAIVPVPPPFTSASILRDARFDGVGPSLGGMARSQTVAGLSLFVEPQLSILLGRTRERLEGFAPNLPPRITRETEEFLSIAEVRVGSDWGRLMPGGGRFFVSSAVEAQYWANAGSLSTDINDMGLLGLSVGLGVDR
jgi:hypothetical protein